MKKVQYKGEEYLTFNFYKTRTVLMILCGFCLVASVSFFIFFIFDVFGSLKTDMTKSDYISMLILFGLVFVFSLFIFLFEKNHNILFSDDKIIKINIFKKETIIENDKNNIKMFLFMGLNFSRDKKFKNGLHVYYHEKYVFSFYMTSVDMCLDLMNMGYNVNNKQIKMSNISEDKNH